MINFIKKRKNNIDSFWSVLVVWWMWDFWKNIILALEKKWYSTIIVDNLENACLSNYRELWKELWYKPVFYEVDIRDIDSIEEVFKKNKISYVLNLSCLWDNNKLTDEKYMPWNFNIIFLNNKYKVSNFEFLFLEI